MRLTSPIPELELAAPVMRAVFPRRQEALDTVMLGGGDLEGRRGRFTMQKRKSRRSDVGMHHVISLPDEPYHD